MILSKQKKPHACSILVLTTNIDSVTAYLQWFEYWTNLLVWNSISKHQEILVYVNGYQCIEASTCSNKKRKIFDKVNATIKGSCLLHVHEHNLLLIEDLGLYIRNSKVITKGKL